MTTLITQKAMNLRGSGRSDLLFSREYTKEIDMRVQRLLWLQKPLVILALILVMTVVVVLALDASMTPEQRIEPYLQWGVFP
jgi:hypothetical protein